MLNIIDNMQKEKDFYSHYIEFEYNQDLVVIIVIVVKVKEK